MLGQQARSRTEEDGEDGGRHQHGRETDSESILFSEEKSAVVHQVHSHDQKALWSSEGKSPVSVWLTDGRWQHVLQPSQLSLVPSEELTLQTTGFGWDPTAR